MAESLSASELRVMNVVWDAGGEASARQIAEALAESVSYTASGTYTIIHRCIGKGALERVDPGFRCRALVSRREVQDEQTGQLIDRLFGGSPEGLFAALVERTDVTPEEARRLHALVDERLGRGASS